MTFGDIRTRVLTRLQVSTTDAAWTGPAGSAINEGQRLFAFLTLCLESSRTFILTPGTKFYHMFLEGWTDWIVPLRVRFPPANTDQTALFDAVRFDDAMFNAQAPGLVPAPSKLKPTSITQMAALDAGWIQTQGTPDRYGCLGWDLMFFNKATTEDAIKLWITYARSPVTLVNDADVPEIPDADHEALIDYGTARMRANEGGQELSAGLQMFKAFLDAASRRAEQVRARSLAQRYDRQPVELEKWDYSRLFNTRAGLVPVRKEDRWTGQT